MTEDGLWSRDIEFEDKTIGGTVPKQYIRPVERGAKDALSSGILAGYPVVGAKITLIDGAVTQDEVYSHQESEGAVQ